jgi:hypothetical protein
MSHEFPTLSYVPWHKIGFSIVIRSLTVSIYGPMMSDPGMEGIMRYVIAASIIVFLTAKSLSADLGCQADEVFVNDAWGCVRASEVEKAKDICKAIGTEDFTQCLCEDAGNIGACGD